MLLISEDTGSSLNAGHETENMETKSQKDNKNKLHMKWKVESLKQRNCSSRTEKCSSPGEGKLKTMVSFINFEITISLTEYCYYQEI